MNEKITVLESECDCEKCSKMCHAPCCGTPRDIELLMMHGLGNRLMYDDLPGGATLIKPALKGYEEMKSPWEVASREGCTFWKKGKCELHNLGLKPIQGKLAHHNNTHEEEGLIGDLINESWEGEEAEKVLESWKKEFIKE